MYFFTKTYTFMKQRQRFKFKVFTEQQKKELPFANDAWWLDVVGFIPSEIRHLNGRRYKLYTSPSKTTSYEILRKS